MFGRIRLALDAVRPARTGPGAAAAAPETRVLEFVSGCYRWVRTEQPPHDPERAAPFRHRTSGGS